MGLPIRKLIADKEISAKGQNRSTTYFPGRKAPTKAAAKPRAAEQLTAAEDELLAHYRRLPPKFQRRLREHAGELETLARAERGRR